MALSRERLYNPGVIRKTAIYSGSVQGVFFRATARELAHDFDVTGCVRNLPDGRVELVAEGEVGEVDRFLAAVGRAKAGNIVDVTVDTGAASGQYASFGIVY